MGLRRENMVKKGDFWQSWLEKVVGAAYKGYGQKDDHPWEPALAHGNVIVTLDLQMALRVTEKIKKIVV